MWWDDIDSPLVAFLTIVAVLVGVWFVCTQYELCVTMPSEWFNGVVSGIMFALVLRILFHRRE